MMQDSKSSSPSSSPCSNSTVSRLDTVPGSDLKVEVLVRSDDPLSGEAKSPGQCFPNVSHHDPFFQMTFYLDPPSFTRIFKMFHVTSCSSLCCYLFTMVEGLEHLLSSMLIRLGAFW